jgi:hypothetical protein
VVVFPIEVLPNIYRYGYAAPCYAISKIARTIIFGTKNQGNGITPVQINLYSVFVPVVGYYFGILIIWIAISCLTLPLFQFLSRRRDVAAAEQVQPQSEKLDA